MIPSELLTETFGEGAKVLAIETAFPQISLALWSGEELLLPQTDLRTKRAASLHEALRELLEKARIGPKDLSSILIDQGPGSYTGLRVGLALAQTMEFTVGSKIHALYSTDLFAKRAAQHAQPGETFGVALDARRKHWSYCLYRSDANTLQRLGDPRCLPAPDLESFCMNLAFVAGPQEGIPVSCHQILLPTPKAADLFASLPLSRIVQRVQPIYLMPPI